MTKSYDPKTDQFTEDVGGGWSRVSRAQTVPLHRTGWAGRWDRLVAWLLRRPRKTVLTSLTSSVYVKGGPVTIDASGPDLQLRIIPPSGGSVLTWGAQASMGAPGYTLAEAEAMYPNGVPDPNAHFGAPMRCEPENAPDDGYLRYSQPYPNDFFDRQNRRRYGSRVQHSFAGDSTTWLEPWTVETLTAEIDRLKRNKKRYSHLVAMLAELEGNQP